MTPQEETERTTLYLDPEVKRRLQERGRSHRQSMSGAANILLTAALDEEDRQERRSPIRLEQIGNHDFYNVYERATGREIGTVTNRGYPKTPWCAIRPEYVAHNPDTAPTYGMARTKEEAAECLLSYQVLDNPT
jgi:plasmid stability protein